MPEGTPRGWRTVPVRSLAQVVSGGTPSRYVDHFWSDGTIPWVTPTDVTSTQGRFLANTREQISRLGLLACSATLVPEGTLLMTSRATLGEIRIAACAVCTNQGFKSLVPLAGTHGLFLYYQMLNNRERYRALGIGSTFLEVSKKYTESFEVLVPVDVTEQRRIAEILSTVDEAIEHTEALIAKTQQIKAGLMHDLFTRGVTPDGKLRPPREEAPHLYKDSPLGWIPRDWRLERAKSLCSLITKGTTPPASAFQTEERVVRFLRVDNLTFHGDLNLEISPIFIDLRTHLDVLARSIIRPGDVLTNIVGPPLGKVALVPSAEHEWNANQAVAIFRVTGLSPEFLKSWLLTFQSKQWLGREAKQTSGQVNLTLQMCGDLPVPVTSAAEQDAILACLRAHGERAKSELNLLRKLRQQKNGLMQDLLTGRVRVDLGATNAQGEIATNV